MTIHMRPLFLLFLVAGASLAASAALQAQTSVVLRCGAGTVETAGFHINQAGEVVFSEPSIACGPQQGNTLPNPLQLSIASPAVGATINVGTSAQTVQFSGQVSNYTSEFDACTLNIQPAPNPGWSVMSLQPGVNGSVAATVQFAQGIAAGTYNFQLACTRTVNQQQVVVPPVSRGLIVTSSTPAPTGCTSYPIPSVFNPVVQFPYDSSYLSGSHSGGWGVPSNQPTPGWRVFKFVNEFANGNLSKATLRTWPFQPAANSSMRLRKGFEFSDVTAISISECPGDFRSSLPAACRRAGGSVYWSTKASPLSSECALDPTKTYYVNIAAIDLTAFHANGVYTHNNACVGSSCTVENGVQTEAVP